MFAEVLTERSELPWSTEKKKIYIYCLTVLNRLSVSFKVLLVDTLAHLKRAAGCKSLSGRARMCPLKTFSQTFYDVTEHTDPEPRTLTPPPASI